MASFLSPICWASWGLLRKGTFLQDKKKTVSMVTEGRNLQRTSQELSCVEIFKGPTLEIPGQFQRRSERQDEECEGPVNLVGPFTAVQCGEVSVKFQDRVFHWYRCGQLLWREYTANREEVASACATQRPGITGHGETRSLGSR